jgi:gliding motility-associated-like protein
MRNAGISDFFNNMKRTALISMLLAFFSFKVFSQGAPACPTINTSGGSVCLGACLPLTASVVANNQTSAYTVGAIPYAPYPYSGGTGVSVGIDDVWSPVINLPFNFCFFGASYTQCIIGSNGQISFDLTLASGYDGWSITTALPSLTNMPVNTICGVFRDIDPALGGSVYYYITGAAPCRALVVCYDNVPLFDNISSTSTCGGTPNSSFQMVLYENTNYIDVYVGNSFSCSTWNGGYGIIGIQNATATTAVCAPGWNYPSTPTGNGVAFRFSPSGAPSYTVTWSDPTGVVGNGLNFNACPGTTTTYTASMTLTNCNGSTLVVTDTAIVTVIPSAAVTVNSPTICAGSSATLTATGATTYTWSANAGGATTSTVSVSPPITTVYTVTANGGGGGGCAPIATSTVTVVPSLTVTVNTPATICQGATTTLTASGAATYTWSPATGLSSVNGTTVTASPNVTTNYTVTGSSGSCPAATATTVVTITPSTTVTVNSATICPATSATLTANGSSGYAWSPATGLSSTTGTTVTGNPAATTVYTVTGSNCSIPGTCTITVVPTCSISVNSATICPTGTATLTANGGGPYTWSPATGLNTASGPTVLANPATTTVYTVTSTTGGFTVTNTATVVVNPSPTITVNNATICQGANTTLTAAGGTTYAWTPVTGLSSSVGSTVVASPGITTNYTVTGTDANGCTNTAIAVVGVNSAPVVTIGPLNSVGCAPVCVNFTSTSTSPTKSCSWSFGDGNTSVACSPNHCYSAKGTYNAVLTLTDFNNCVGTATTSATVYPNPHADFTATPQPTSILEPGIQFIDLTSGATVTGWNWNFGDVGLNDTSGLQNPKHLYGDTGNYFVYLHVVTAYGCKDSTIKMIRIEDDYELFVPNAFTPNGDGVNEVFLPQMRGVSPDSYKLYIFDRWGNSVFQTTNIDKGWDGTKKGDVVMEDVYVWKIELKTTQGLKKQIHGQVSVVK